MVLECSRHLLLNRFVLCQACVFPAQCFFRLLKLTIVVVEQLVPSFPGWMNGD